MNSNVGSEEAQGVKVGEKEFWTEKRELLALSTPLHFKKETQ